MERLRALADAVVNHQPALARRQMEVLIDTSDRNFADVRRPQLQGAISRMAGTSQPAENDPVPTY